jgi:1,4-dihydroxy-2-naphthoate octaprenyltransferase
MVRAMADLKTWLLASRPKTLPAASVPVLVGTAVAIQYGRFVPGPALAALVGALLIQIGANLANDVFDFKKGADTAERLGPTRVTQAGLLTPRQVFSGMTAVFAVAVAIGSYLVAMGGWPIVAIGIASILSAIAYTGGPFPLGYHGLGDVFVFLFFGLVAVCGTFYVQALTLAPAVWWAAVPIGLLATAILVVNNLRDIETDRKAGKRTLAVRLGRNGVIAEYGLLVVASYLVPLAMIVLGLASPWVMLPWLSLPLAIGLWKRVRILEGKPLNQVLADTARLELVFGVLFAVGLTVPR